MRVRRCEKESQTILFYTLLDSAVSFNHDWLLISNLVLTYGLELTFLSYKFLT